MNKNSKKLIKTPLPNIKNLVIANFICNSPLDKKMTLGAYCEMHDIDYSNAAKALQGKWSGKKAKALRSRLLAASKEKGGCHE